MSGLRSENLTTEIVVYQQGAIQIVVKKMADVAAVELLKRTVYGTSGIQYQHTGQETKINQLHHPFFFHLTHNEKLISLYCLDERKINIAGGFTTSGFYGRYLSIAANQQGRGYGRLLKREAVRYIDKNTSSPHVFYAYIEEKNVRSLRISESEGFRSIATLKTFVFRRYSPKIDARFSCLPEPEKERLITRLTDVYRNYNFTTFARIGYQNNYFVLIEDGEIIAGVQANPVCWKFSAMPGLSGWLMMHILPLTTATRRFFNPVLYQFLTLEGIYLKEGREETFSVLLESVLGHFGYHSALLQIATNDPLNTLLADTKKMGLLSGFQQNITTRVMLKSGSGRTVPISQDNPAYVSSFDFS